MFVKELSYRAQMGGSHILYIVLGGCSHDWYVAQVSEIFLEKEVLKLIMNASLAFL